MTSERIVQLNDRVESLLTKFNPHHDAQGQFSSSGGGGGSARMFGSKLTEGDSVKVKGPVKGKGKHGKIVTSAPSGEFHIVRFKDGTSGNYQSSDLQRTTA